jgi:hypothetical protein
LPENGQQIRGKFHPRPGTDRSNMLGPAAQIREQRLRACEREAAAREADQSPLNVRWRPIRSPASRKAALRDAIAATDRA